MIIAWINFIVLIASALLMANFYVRSVGPAELEKQVGEAAYARCTRYRLIASAFEFVAVANYVVYYFHPLPVPVPQGFPWDYWISTVIAVAIGVPGSCLMWRGMKDAGDKRNIGFLIPKRRSNAE